MTDEITDPLDAPEYAEHLKALDEYLGPEATEPLKALLRPGAEARRRAEAERAAAAEAKEREPAAPPDPMDDPNWWTNTRIGVREQPQRSASVIAAEEQDDRVLDAIMRGDTEAARRISGNPNVGKPGNKVTGSGRIGGV